MHVFLTSVQSVVSILLLMSVGYFCDRLGWFGEQFSNALSKLIMKVALPAGIFMAMLKRFKLSQLGGLSDGLLYVLLSIGIGYIIAWIIVKIMKVPRGRRGVMMTAFNGANTVFIGMPLNLALFGSVAVPYLLVYYIINTVVIWTFGVWVIAADDPTSKKMKIDWHHFLPAPLWGFIVAMPFIIWWPQADTELPMFITRTLSSLGALITPLSLIYIGIMLQRSGLGNVKINLDTFVTVIGRFVISPIIMGIIIWCGMNYAGVDMVSIFRKTLVVQSATPCLAVLPILAHTYNCDVEFSTNIVVITSILFIVVTPLIMLVLNWI